MQSGAFCNPERQQQLRDDQLINDQLPNNRVGTSGQRGG
jgi:hypothetical protein